MSSTDSLFAEFHGRLRAFLLGRVSSSADVDDIVQSVFIRIHRSLQGGEIPREPLAWVFQIARTTLIDHYRKQASEKRRQALFVDYSALPIRPTPQEVTLQAFDDESRRALSECVRPFIESLPEKQREALIWTALEGASQKDAAARAGISISGMKSRVQRGRKQLAARLLKCCDVDLDRRGKPIGHTPKTCSGC